MAKRKTKILWVLQKVHLSGQPGGNIFATMFPPSTPPQLYTRSIKFGKFLAGTILLLRLSSNTDLVFVWLDYSFGSGRRHFGLPFAACSSGSSYLIIPLGSPFDSLSELLCLPWRGPPFYRFRLCRGLQG